MLFKVILYNCFKIRKNIIFIKNETYTSQLMNVVSYLIKIELVYNYSLLIMVIILKTNSYFNKTIWFIEEIGQYMTLC